MGDVGAIPLGFLAATLGLHGMQLGAWQEWFPVLIFSPFILDATVTLLKRALRREKVWQAHREHYYQRLVRAGWSHRKLVLHEYGIMLALAASACVMLVSPPAIQAGGLLFWAVLLGVVMLKIDSKLKSRD
jgi:UDP-N-acetylmuramyl pentapeptide phosphotransferase/UDP-N-acetylglucosamine-1-phosphate transferase